jgi:hypothetical protein
MPKKFCKDSNWEQKAAADLPYIILELVSSKMTQLTIKCGWKIN